METGIWVINTYAQTKEMNRKPQYSPQLPVKEKEELLEEESFW